MAGIIDNVVQFPCTKRAEPDVPNEEYGVGALVRSLYTDPKEQAAKVFAHCKGSLMRWQKEARKEIDIDREIELLQEALIDAQTAKASK